MKATESQDESLDWRGFLRLWVAITLRNSYVGSVCEL